jgi:carbon-monoxide dehydrogenase large subunit
MTTKLFGSSIKRREDPRLITGKGTFTDNLKLPGMVFAFIVRSPHAHARIKTIDVGKAKAHPGVIAVFTGADMQAAKVGSIPTGWLHPGIKIPPHPPIAVDKVNHVGDAVAVVLAEDRYTARDAADLVRVDYETLPAVVDMEKAVKGQPAGRHPCRGARQRGVQLEHRRQGENRRGLRQGRQGGQGPHRQ